MDGCVTAQRRLQSARLLRIEQLEALDPVGQPPAPKVSQRGLLRRFGRDDQLAQSAVRQTPLAQVAVQ
jgi:hypothetical protein